MTAMVMMPGTGGARMRATLQASSDSRPVRARARAPKREGPLEKGQGGKPGWSEGQVRTAPRSRAQAPGPPHPHHEDLIMMMMMMSIIISACARARALPRQDGGDGPATRMPSFLAAWQVPLGKRRVASPGRAAAWSAASFLSMHPVAVSRGRRPRVPRLLRKDAPRAQREPRRQLPPFPNGIVVSLALEVAEPGAPKDAGASCTPPVWGPLAVGTSGRPAGAGLRPRGAWCAAMPPWLVRRLLVGPVDAEEAAPAHSCPHLPCISCCRAAQDQFYEETNFRMARKAAGDAVAEKVFPELPESLRRSQTQAWLEPLLRAADLDGFRARLTGNDTDELAELGLYSAAAGICRRAFRGTACAAPPAHVSWTRTQLRGAARAAGVSRADLLLVHSPGGVGSTPMLQFLAALRYRCAATGRARARRRGALSASVAGPTTRPTSTCSSTGRWRRRCASCRRAWARTSPLNSSSQIRYGRPRRRQRRRRR
eukprot:scaffold434_cov358-Prasinococcus_capsulatus_cf.AAC.24